MHYAWTFPTLAGTWEKGTSTDPNGHVTTYEMAYAGSPLRTTDALSHARLTTYTANFDTATAQDALRKTVTYGYDTTTNLPSSVSIPTGAAATAQYGTTGLVCMSTDTTHPYQPEVRQGHARKYQHVRLRRPGEPMTVTNAASIAVNLTYNPATPTCGGFKGQMCSSDDGAGSTHKTTYAYNPNGYLTTITPPSALGTTLFTYDSAGRVATMTDGKSQVTTYTYDADNRVTQVLLLSATTCVYANNTCITYGFDSNGNLNDRHDKSGDTTFHYTVMNRNDTITPLATTALSATYDHVGNMASYTDAEGTVTYDYFNNNTLKDLYEPGGSCTGTISLCTTLGYDNNGSRTTTTYPGGTVMTATLDDSGRVKEIKAIHSATTISDFAYIYGGDTLATDTSQVTSRTDNVASRVTTYTYDIANRLGLAVEKNGATTAASWRYGYDNAGNRTSYSTTAGATCPGGTTYTHNTADELTAVNGTSTGWSYNLNGLETAGNSTLPRTAERYTGSNALKTLTVGGTAYAATYAGVGNDQRLTFDTLTYTSGELGLAYQTNGTTTQAFTRDNSGTLISDRTGGASYHHIYDGQRSTTGILVNPRRYTGAHADSTTGLVHLGAWYYDASLGRFTQPDPSDQEVNGFAYASSDPANGHDPTGRCTAQSVIFDLGGAALGGYTAY